MTLQAERATIPARKRQTQEQQPHNVRRLGVILTINKVLAQAQRGKQLSIEVYLHNLRLKMKRGVLGG